MKILNTLLMLLLFANIAWSQCSPSDYPQNITIYDLYLCGNPPSATDFKPQHQKDGLIHKKVKFHFPDDFWLDNLEAWFDFDDGQGLQLLQDGNTTYTTTYPSSGKKDITYYWSSDPEALSVHAFSITIKEESAEYESPDIIWELETETAYIPPSGQYPPTSPYGIPSKGKGNAYVRLAEGHVNLTRPIIFVEGLDFGVLQHREPYNSRVVRYGDNGWDVFTMGALEVVVPSDQEELFKNVPTQFQDFNDAGYDIVLLDFEDGATYVQKNVEVLKELIRKVNTAKNPDVNGIIHDNIVVGASMGGIISRYALAQMEAEGETHCTSTYISFDAPHQGANISLSMQSLIWFNSTFFEYNATNQDIEIARSLWSNINRPAPRQLNELPRGRAQGYRSPLNQIRIALFGRDIFYDIFHFGS